MTTRITLFTQPGCFSCELIRVFLEAKQIAFEERDISIDDDARRAMLELHGSHETPTLVIFAEDRQHVVVGFDPNRLDQLLASTPSSGSVTES